MKILKKIMMMTVVGLFLVSSAFAMKADYETVSNYHKVEIEQLLKDYTLEDSLTIRIELKRKDNQLDEEKIVSLPGLYQKTGDTSDANVEKILNLYERKVVFIKKREISEDELKLVKSSLSERLFLPEDTQFTELDDTPKIDDAVQNMKQDFVFGAYNTLIKNGQFLWILIFSIGFIVALWVLAKVWKAKGESAAGGEISMAGGGPGAAADPSADKSNDSETGLGGNISLDNSSFETFNFGSLCQNINDAFKKAPGSTASVLWSHIPDLQSQIQFYEIIRIQTQISDEILNESCKVIDSIFSFEKRASQNKGRSGKGFTKNTLSTISVELARLKFTQPHSAIEDVYSAIYPLRADNIESIFKNGLEKHYIVLYKVFKDQFMNYVSESTDANVLDKINDLLMFDPSTDHASDEQYAKFVDFLKSDAFDDVQEEKKAVNLKVVHMIYGLSEEELDKVEAMKTNEDLKAEVPSLSWVNTDDAGKFKAFMISLSGPEAECFLAHNNSNEEAFKTLDERTQFRIQERITKEKDSSLNWRAFRNKIKQVYTYKDAASNEEELSKAS